MIILPTTLAVMLAALLCRWGRRGLVRLAAIELRGSVLIGLAASLQIGNMLTPDYRLPLLLLSAVPAILFCWLNRRHPGMLLVTAGVLLNLLVMVLNAGHMPISPATVTAMRGPEVLPGDALIFSKDRVLDDAQAVLPWLGDRILLPGPLAPLAAWSVGDMLLLAGIFQLLARTMKGPHHYDRSLWRWTALSRA